MTIKKIGLIIFLSLIAFLPLITAKAQTPGQLPTGNDLGINESPIQDVPGLVSALGSFVHWTYIVFFIFAVFFILLAAYKFLTARGDPAEIQEARKAIIWALIAIVVAFLSVGLEVIIQNFLGSNSSITGTQGAPADYTNPDLDAYGNPYNP